ncbi:hypothetical protein MAR_011082, partial [Mya arenaria]
MFVVNANKQINKSECVDCLSGGTYYNVTVECSGVAGYSSNPVSQTIRVSVYSDTEQSFTFSGGDSINVFQNSSGEGSVIATLNVNYIENSQDEDRLTYRLESGPGPAWITGHTLFAMNPSNGHISVRKSLADEFSYDAFNM